MCSHSNIMQDAIVKCFAFKALSDALHLRYSRKQGDNIVSAVHAIGAVLLGIRYFMSGDDGDLAMLQSFSSGYFAYDLLQIVSYKKIRLMETAYIYHHLAGIYMLLLPQGIVPGEAILFLGELSNLPSYPLYHYLHTLPLNKRKIQFYKTLQKMMYVGIRSPLMTLLMIQFYNSPNYNNKLAYPVFPVYFMGLYWSYKILFK